MTTAQTRINLVRNQVNFYETETESWKAAHDAAMCCFEFEGLLDLGIRVFEQINRLDEDWRDLIYKGTLAHEKDFDNEIEKLYGSWLKVAHKGVKRLKSLEKDGFEITGAEEFRRCVREAEGILTPDRQVFADPALVKTRDDALDAHRRSDTIEIRSLSD